MSSLSVPAHPVGRPSGWWGMLLVIATEAALFAVLIASYFYLRFRSPGPWPPDGLPEPSLLIPLAMTVLLALSGVTVYAAERGIRVGDQRRLRVGIALTVLLGIGFLVLQAIGYHRTLTDVSPRTDAYGSMFFTISGLHVAHIVIGLLLLLWTLLFAWRRAYTAEHHVAVQVSGLYWQFVNVLWLIVFVCLYLSPRL